MTRDGTSRRCRRYDVVITDDLARPRLAYVAGSAMLNGSANGVTVAGLADHGRLLRRVRPARAGRLRGAALPRGGRLRRSRTARVITNTGTVTWNTTDADRERERLGDRGRDAGRRDAQRHGLARRQLRRRAGGSERPLVGLDRRADPQRLGALRRWSPTRAAPTRSARCRRTTRTATSTQLRFTRAGRGPEHRHARPHGRRRSRTGMQLISDIVVTVGQQPRRT